MEPCRIQFVVILGLVLSIGCGGVAQEDEDGPDGLSPTAHLDTFRWLKEDLEAERHPSDGVGRAWFDPAPERLVVGERAHFSLVFEAGPEGIDEGGAVYLMPSPFWGWSPPQTVHPAGPGYCRVTTEAEGIELQVRAAGQLLVVTIGGRTLVEGERLTFEYGAGEAGAVVDAYAERDARLWLAVDGDGDGIRSIITDSPAIEIGPGPAARIHTTLPSVARPGEPVEMVLAMLDAVGNAGVDFGGTVRLDSDIPVEGFPRSVVLQSGDHGKTKVGFTAPSEGLVRITAATADGLRSVSNPMVVSPEGPRVYWGDLHGHSARSDGTGTPEDYFTYARDVAGLDVAALTDHDHWGVDFLDQSEGLWAELRETARIFHQPGRFVTLPGYEWTNWLHGHRHVLFFGDRAPLFSSMDERTDTPPELWGALDGHEAVTVAHHSAGGPIATNWTFAPDPQFEPITEVVSVHGSSEAADSPQAIASSVAGNFVRDVLGRGYRFGFVGSGDGHDGHPGLAHLGTGVGGLAAIMADELTREGVLRAIRDRRVYATNGRRIVLRMAVDGRPMGSVLDAPRARAIVYVGVWGTAPIERVEIIRGPEVVARSEDLGGSQTELSLHLDGLRHGEWVYVRVVQSDGGMAWSSPVYFDEEGP